MPMHRSSTEANCTHSVVILVGHRAKDARRGAMGVSFLPSVFPNYYDARGQESGVGP